MANVVAGRKRKINGDICGNPKPAGHEKCSSKDQADCLCNHVNYMIQDTST